MKSQNYFTLLLLSFLSFNVFAEDTNIPLFPENLSTITPNFTANNSLDTPLASTASTNCSASNYLTLTLNFDAFPEHTSWDIRDANYQILMASSGFTTPNTSITQTLPWLASGDYLLVVYDINGDGMAPGGSYELKDSQGNVLVSGSSFAASDVNEFCVVSSNGGGLDLIPPTVPLNLTASNPTQTSIDIAFTAATDNLMVLGYVVFMNDVYIGDIYAADPLAVTVPNLTPNTTYTFQVATVDVAGNFSPFSNIATETTLPALTATVFHQGYFETGWDGWIDGGTDCARYSGANAAEGSRAIRLRDNTSTSIMTLNNQNLSSYTDVTIDFEYYIESFEGNEDFWLRYYNGSSWQTIATFTKGIDFPGNGFYSGSVSINSLAYNFATNSGFRFQCDASADNDKVYIDKVIMTGYAPAVSNLIAVVEPGPANTTKLSSRYGIIDEVESIFTTQAPAVKTGAADLNHGAAEVPAVAFNLEENVTSIQLYPNPADTYFRLSLEDPEQIEALHVLTLNGQRLKTFHPMLTDHDISDLNPGMYVVAVVTKDHGTQYLKLLKTK